MSTTNLLRRPARLAGLLFPAFLISAPGPIQPVRFTVSMERPASHTLHVEMSCEVPAGASLDLRLPVWTPGYYWIMDFARNLTRFRAADGAGRPLAWEKTTKNNWRVRTRGANRIAIGYDVFAFGRSVAESRLDDSLAFISPTGVFMNIAGQLQRPALVVVRPAPGWTRISTGLDPVAGQAGTYSAPDFDTLYDCPLLVGRPQAFSFEVQGIPHEFVENDLSGVDREKLAADLKRVIEAATAIFGEIPYRHYSFLSIGPGMGGLEHANSVLFTMRPEELATASGYQRFLSFLAHEYFHLFNVKRIRPAEMWPYDYDRENFTPLLWVSEGLSVYYQELVMRRAGLSGRDEFLERMSSCIAAYENVPGHRVQSATASSVDTWINFFNRGANAANTTISYYDKGAALGLLLDLEIRHRTQSRKSLDDVMRGLYRTYYREKRRGFTETEFQALCEATAGCRLNELFAYAATVQEIDYAKYLAYAGLGIDTQPHPLPGGYLGARTRDQEGRTLVVGVVADSPADRAGLSPDDEIVALDGARVDSAELDRILGQKKPGQAANLLVARGGRMVECAAVIARKEERTFAIKWLPDPTPEQKALREAWLK